MYNLMFTEEFRRAFDKLGDKETQSRILRKMLELKKRPSLGKMLTGIKDEYFGRLYRLRVGKYRVIYAVRHEENEIYIITVAHRGTVYDTLD